ncbi:hypothetical protein [Loktanella sp. M215]|uniref:hypothetical protein n=1 Tax=Loktanella sp. M215 TaxID=2675431 RepID=UPI001F2166A5|nr:hypothetical protein [Loktanella sp. M215]
MAQEKLPLEGLTILLVEDEPLIALDIAMILQDAGATVIGPCKNVVAALLRIQQGSDKVELHGAVLDVDLGDETSIPVARVLKDNEIPFVFHTGMNPLRHPLLADFDVPVVSKPSTSTALIAAIQSQIAMIR